MLLPGRSLRMPWNSWGGRASPILTPVFLFPTLLPVGWLGPGTNQEEAPGGPLLRADLTHCGHAQEDAPHRPEHVLPHRPRADQPGQDPLCLGERVIMGEGGDQQVLQGNSLPFPVMAKSPKL